METVQEINEGPARTEKPPTIKSSMFYLDRDQIYDNEKPYSMRYQPLDGTPQSNFIKSEHPITVRSMRERDAGPFHLDECGFQLIPLKSQLKYDEYWDNEKIQQIYVQEVKDALKTELHAKFVHVLDYAVRKRDPMFPISTGEEYKYDQPTAMAHIDFTRRDGERMIKVLFGDEAPKVLKGRWQAINIWKPIKGPLNDWPLGLCDARSINFKDDTVPTDIVFNEFVTENLQIFHNPGLQWYYLPDHSLDEALIFKSADSDQGSTAPGCAHSGFYNSEARNEFRESLDCRCLVFFTDLDTYPPIVGDIFQPQTHILVE